MLFYKNIIVIAFAFAFTCIQSCKKVKKKESVLPEEVAAVKKIDRFKDIPGVIPGGDEPEPEVLYVAKLSLTSVDVENYKSLNIEVNSASETDFHQFTICSKEPGNDSCFPSQNDPAYFTGKSYIFPNALSGKVEVAIRACAFSEAEINLSTPTCGEWERKDYNQPENTDITSEEKLLNIFYIQQLMLKSCRNLRTDLATLIEKQIAKKGKITPENITTIEAQLINYVRKGNAFCSAALTDPVMLSFIDLFNSTSQETAKTAGTTETSTSEATDNHSKNTAMLAGAGILGLFSVISTSAGIYTYTKSPKAADNFIQNAKNEQEAQIKKLTADLKDIEEKSKNLKAQSSPKKEEIKRIGLEIKDLGEKIQDTKALLKTLENKNISNQEKISRLVQSNAQLNNNLTVKQKAKEAVLDMKNKLDAGDLSKLRNLILAAERKYQIKNLGTLKADANFYEGMQYNSEQRNNDIKFLDDKISDYKKQKELFELSEKTKNTIEELKNEYDGLSSKIQEVADAKKLANSAINRVDNEGDRTLSVILEEINKQMQFISDNSKNFDPTNQIDMLKKRYNLGESKEYKDIRALFQKNKEKVNVKKKPKEINDRMNIFKNLGFFEKNQELIEGENIFKNEDGNSVKITKKGDIYTFNMSDGLQGKILKDISKLEDLEKTGLPNDTINDKNLRVTDDLLRQNIDDYNKKIDKLNKDPKLKDKAKGLAKIEIKDGVLKSNIAEQIATQRPQLEVLKEEFKKVSDNDFAILKEQSEKRKEEILIEQKNVIAEANKKAKDLNGSSKQIATFNSGGSTTNFETIQKPSLTYGDFTLRDGDNIDDFRENAITKIDEAINSSKKSAEIYRAKCYEEIDYRLNHLDENIANTQNKIEKNKQSIIDTEKLSEENAAKSAEKLNDLEEARNNIKEKQIELENQKKILKSERESLSSELKELQIEKANKISSIAEIQGKIELQKNTLSPEQKTKLATWKEKLSFNSKGFSLGAILGGVLAAGVAVAIATQSLAEDEQNDDTDLNKDVQNIMTKHNNLLKELQIGILGNMNDIVDGG